MDEQTPIQQARSVLWILWFALVLGPLVFIGIAGYLGGILSEEEMSVEGLPMILGGVAALIILQSLIVTPTIGRNVCRERLRAASGPEELLSVGLDSVRTVSIIGWASAEGGAILLGVTILLAGWHNWSIGVIALFLIVMAFQAPTEDRVMSQLESHLDAAGRSRAETGN